LRARSTKTAKSKKTRAELHPPVYIEWIDSSTTGAVWTTKGDLREVINARVRTIGFVIHETDTNIVICHSIGDDEDEEVGGDISIPKVAIRKRRAIRLPLK